MKIKHSQNGEITLSPTDVVGESCHSCSFLTWQICLFNAIRENNTLAKISGFTIHVPSSPHVLAHFFTVSDETHSYSKLSVKKEKNNITEFKQYYSLDLLSIHHAHPKR